MNHLCRRGVSSPLLHSRRYTPLAWAAVLALGGASIGAIAGPEGGQVVAGQAAITSQGASTLISQQSQRAVIDWRSFNVGAAEKVHFAQPGPTAATLNRIVGNDASRILGRITADGQVYLVNPNGIVFGRTAQVDTAGLVASTANVANGNFMAGRLDFNEPGRPGAAVRNEGRITIHDAGMAALVAPHVGNSGTITARLGKVTLAAGDAFVLDLFGDKLLSFAVAPAALARIDDAQGQPLTARVDHSGSIVADGGRVQITAQTAQRLLDSAINVSGLVQATSVASRPGWISLQGDAGSQVTLSGRLDASGGQGKGGDAEISGGQVLLAGAAHVDASGRTGGGTVAIGGGWRGNGAGAGVPVSQSIAIGPEITIDASALISGAGGTVSVVAAGDTVYAGTIAARGGVHGGDGGRVEVSGLGRLAFAGDVDASAAAGRSGLLLLDPANITIAASGGALPAAGAAGDFTVGVDNLRRVLTRGTSVALEASNAITVNAAIDGRLPSGGVTGGGLALTAGGDVTLNNNVILNDGAFSATAGGHFTQASGSLLATGSGGISVAAAAGIQAQQLITSGGAVTLASSAGAVSVAQAIVGPGTAGRAGALTVSGTGIVLNGSRVAAATLTADAGGVRLDGVFDATGALGVVTPGEFVVGSANASSVKLRRAIGSDAAAGRFTLTGTLVASGDVDIKTTEAIALKAGSGIQSGGMLALTTAQRLSTDAATSAAPSAPQAPAQSAATLVAGGAVELRAASLDLQGDVQAGGNARSLLHADGAAQLGGKLLAGGTGALRIEGASVSHTGGNAIAAGSGGLDIEATGGALQAQQLLTTGDVKLRALNGALTVGKAIVGPAPAGDPTQLVDARALDVAGQSVQLAGGRFAQGAKIASGSTLVLTDTLQAAGATALAAGSDVTLAALNVGSLSLRAALGGSAAAGGALMLKGDVKSAGAIDLRATALASTDAGVKVDAGGDLSIGAAAIRIGAGVLGADPALPVSAANPLNTAGAGLRTTAAGSMLTLSASGAGAGDAIDVLGSLRTTGVGAQVHLVAASGDAHVAEIAGTAAFAIHATTGKLVLDKVYGPALALTASGDVQLVKEAVMAGDFNASVRGTLTQAADGLIDSGSGAIIIDADRGLSAQQLVSDGGAVSLISSGGAINVARPMVGPGPAADYKRTGAVTATGTSVAVAGGRVGSASLTATGGGTIDVQGTLDAAGLLQLRTDGAVALASATTQGASLRGQAGGDSRAGSFTLTGSLVSTGAAAIDLRSVGDMTLQAGTEAGVLSAAALTLDSAAALTVKGNAIATGAGLLRLAGATFSQGSAAKISAGTGGLKIATTGDLTAAGQLLSVGGVDLDSGGGALSVSAAIVAQSSPATPGEAGKAAFLNATGRSVALAGGRFAGPVDISSRGTLKLSGALASDGVVQLAAAGDVSLRDVGAAGLTLRRTLGGMSGAEGNLHLDGNIVSKAGVDLLATGLISTAVGSKVFADGDITLRGMRILIAAGTDPAQPGDAGLQANGSGELLLGASGNTASAGDLPPAIDVRGSVRTAGGAIELKAERGNIYVAELADSKAVTTATGAAKASATAIASVTADAGNIALDKAYAGTLTLSAPAGNIDITREVGTKGLFAATAAGTYTQTALTNALLDAGSVDIRGALGVAVQRLVGDGGKVDLTSTAGAVTVADAIVGPGTIGATGALTATGTSVRLNGGRVTAATLTATQGGTVTVADTLDAAGVLGIYTTGDVNLSAPSINAAGVIVQGDSGVANSRVAGFALGGKLVSSSGVSIRASNDVAVDSGAGLASSGKLVFDTLGSFGMAGGRTSDGQVVAPAVLAAGFGLELRASSLNLRGKLQTAGSGVSLVKAGSTVQLDGDIKAAAAGLLSIEGSSFSQGSSSVIETAAGGLSIKVGRGALTATQLVSSGGVELTGGAVTVGQAIVGPADGRTGPLTVNADSLRLAGGRFSGAVDLASAADLQMTGVLDSQSAVRLAAGGKVTLLGVSAESLTLHDVRGGSGSAGGDLAVNGDVKSGGALSLYSAGSVVTAPGSHVQARGRITVRARDIFIGAGTVDADGRAVAADDAGLDSTGAAGMELHATGGGVAATPTSIDVRGSLRTAGGDLTVQADDGGISLAVIKTTTLALNGTTRITATKGDVVLTRALGGNSTGYDVYAKGYQSSLKPGVGALFVTAAKAIETNGLNLDGIGDAGAGGVGLLLATTGTASRVIVNQKIAVNKGDIVIDAGNGNALIGASIFSRGHDLVNGIRDAGAPTGDAPDLKTAYGIRISGAKLGFWDNDDGMAILPFPDPVRITERARQLVAKITVGNNSANYVDTANVETLVPSQELPASGVELIGSLSGLSSRAGSVLQAAEAAPALVSLTQVGHLASFEGGSGVQSAGLGLAVKLLGFRAVGDKSSSTAGAPVCFRSPSGCQPNSYAFPSKPDFSLDPQSAATVGMANLLNVSDTAFKGNVEGTFSQAGSFSTSYQGSVTVSGRYIETIPSTDKIMGTRMLLYPSTMAITSGSTAIENNGRTSTSGANSPSNSSNTGYQPIGSFGAATVANSIRGSLVTLIGVTSAGNVTPGLPSAAASTFSGSQVVVTSAEGGNVSASTVLANASTAGNAGAFGNAAITANATGAAPALTGATQGTQTLTVALPPASDIPPITTGTQTITSTTTAENLQRESADGRAQTALLVLRPAAQADLGRAGSQAGAAAQVFGRRYLLGRSLDPALCVPDDLAPVGPAAETCKPLR